MVTYHDIVFAVHQVARQLHVPIVLKPTIILSAISGVFPQRHPHRTTTPGPRALPSSRLLTLATHHPISQHRHHHARPSTT